MQMLRGTAHKTGAFPGQGNCNGEFGKKEMKTKHKKLRGAVRVAGVSSSWKFVKSNVLREYDVDLLGRFYDFSLQASSFVQSTAVCSATYRRHLLLQILYPYHTISAVTALQAAAQLEVACPIFCVRRDEHRSIDRPVCPFFAWPASSCCCCWLRLLLRCYTSSRRIKPNVYWLEELEGPAAQRFGEWASASRTFSAITDLIAVVQCEVDRLCSFFNLCKHAPPPPACLVLRLLLTAATVSPSRHHNPTWRWCT